MASLPPLSSQHHYHQASNSLEEAKAAPQSTYPIKKADASHLPLSSLAY